MKRAFLCLMAMCLFSLLGAAQSTPTTTEKGGHAGMKHGMSGEKTLTGCVAQEPGESEFMLQTGGKKNVELETTEDLKPHIGHTVKVTGMWDMEKDKSEAMGGGDEKKGTAEHKMMKEHHFKVSKMEMVSESCKMGSGKAKMKMKKSANPS